ncbi:PREDICTED: glutathione S-transferase T3-like [Camelina sativa]|uniref:Glutathione S-transferase T3-like n=1 Tax=Camelina sativa TaxID=90675 RepID=A0ABM0ZCC3_CAMSA|nr:PREDICTED: glutathione S-transferase T3-like [Camelina sativa]
MDLWIIRLSSSLRLENLVEISDMFVVVLGGRSKGDEESDKKCRLLSCIQGTTQSSLATRFLILCSRTKGRRSRNKWAPADDVELIGAWLNTSKDPIVSNGQKGEAYWKWVAEYFNASPKVVGLEKRAPSHIKQRWGKINDNVCKFVGCYEAATKQRSSGQNEDDVMKLANEIYFNDHKVKFTLQHAWLELRYDQKWCASSSSKGNGTAKRRKGMDGSSSSQPVNHREDDSMIRPPGVKASKAKKKECEENSH